MTKIETSIAKETTERKVSYQDIIYVYYTALMVFLVFTAANGLISGLLKEVHIELLLYVLLWVSMVVQTTFAYKHIMDIHKNDYNIFALISDSVDICIFIYVCAAIGNTCTENGFTDMTSYQHISVPFLILSFNQLCWYIFVKEKKKAAAAFRLILQFVAMLIVTIMEEKLHCVGLLAFIVGWNMFVMVILRAINKVPQSIRNMFE